MTALHATRGYNYWSRRPVTRMDLVVGAYDEISSAEVPGFTDSLLRAMPGLVEHQCSIGERGGFVTRLRRGTYAPHIVEHVALELQSMIGEGHDVGYGRTRGGDVHGEYTLVFEHRHEQVGLRAAALALETVQRAFAGTLEDVRGAVAELTALAATPDAPPIRQRVFCGITGGAGRDETRRALADRLAEPDELIVDVSPAFLLQAGLPYHRSELAIVLDTDLPDVPPRYRDRDRAERLVGTVADAVERDGFVVCPADAWDVQRYARDRDCRVAVFSTGEPDHRDLSCATAVGMVRDGRIRLERCGDPEDAGPLSDDVPARTQVAVALAAYVLAGRCGREGAAS